MPEGPEVRRYADALAAALEDREILDITARLKLAKAWLAEFKSEIVGKQIRRIRSHGKHLIGYIANDVYFHSHLMMWGRWTIFRNETPEVDRRERVRIVAPDVTAVLLSAPTFGFGRGNPYEQIPVLASLGVDVLPYSDAGGFDEQSFLQRLLTPEYESQTIGAILLDQRVLAGVGNYLRAEILFECKINPWREVGELSDDDVRCLCRETPRFARLAYQTGGYTVAKEVEQRLLTEPGMSYRLGSEWGARHRVFRRTNLPCVNCGEKVRQKRQVTRSDEEAEKTRIIYFCPNCQNVNL